MPYSIKTLRKIRASRKTMVKKLDKLVGMIVVARDKRCVTCGTKDNLHPGHLFSRVAYSTRWDLTNVFAQCNSCNFRHEHDPYPLTSYFLNLYGQGAYDLLHQLYANPVKWNSCALEELYILLSAKWGELK